MIYGEILKFSRGLLPKRLCLGHIRKLGALFAPFDEFLETRFFPFRYYKHSPVRLILGIARKPQFPGFLLALLPEENPLHRAPNF
ncbi:MAG: hypothetical protein UX77_C0008G0024 [Parcubacteria group bacterium GW2011_GWA1_47_11]|nr:MAG: hypothetical protein UX77_C0008G0024 [Parcubacteria group bacterium GW2011_GWA1_47_11]